MHCQYAPLCFVPALLKYREQGFARFCHHSFYAWQAGRLENKTRRKDAAVAKILVPAVPKVYLLPFVIRFRLCCCSRASV